MAGAYRCRGYAATLVTAAAGVYAPGRLPPRSRAIKLKARQHCGIPQVAVGIVVRQDIDEDVVQEPGMTSARLSPGGDRRAEPRDRRRRALPTGCPPRTTSRENPVLTPKAPRRKPKSLNWPSLRLSRALRSQVTNQVTTPPGNAGRRTTFTDIAISLTCGNRPNPTAPDGTGMHGKEKVYGSIP